MTLDPAFHAALRGALGLLLLHAAAHKLRSPARFRAAFAGYRVVPDRLVSAAAALVVLSELVAGIGLLAPGAGAVPALLAAALLYASADLALAMAPRLAALRGPR